MASISSKEAEAVFRDFTQKYKTTKEARAALLKLKKYENTRQYKNIRFLLDNGKWEDWIKHETFMRGVQDNPVASFFLNTGKLPRNPTLNFNNKNLNQLNINSNGNKSNPSSQGKGNPAFVTDNRVSLDKETALRNGTFIKTKIPPVKRAQV